MLPYGTIFYNNMLLVDVVVLSLCSFLGNVGVSLTGFGMAIVYIFVWQISSLSGYDGDFKYAIFIQSLALVSVQPILLYKANVRKHASRKMLLYFIPITIISTPLGQLTSDHVSINTVKSVGGIIVFLVSIREVYMKRYFFFSYFMSNESEMPKSRKSPTTNCGDENETPSAYPKADESDDEVPNMNEKNEEEISGTDEDEGQSIRNETTEKDDDQEASNLDTESKEMTSLGLSAIFWTLFAGFASGYLGGLCAIRGPPLIIYFLHPPQPIQFTNKSQRATGVCITVANVLLRVIYYAVESITDEVTLFKTDDWYLYLSVILSSLFGVFIGTALFKRLKDYKDSIRGVLTIMLLICGISLLITAFV